MSTYTYDTMAHTTIGCIKVVERRVRQLIAGVPQIVRAPKFVWDRSGERFVMLVPVWRDRDGVPWLLTIEEFKFGVFAPIISFPGGGVDPEDVDEEAAARRELFEETGLKVGSLILLARNLVEFPDKVAGGEHSVFIGEVGDLHTSGKPEYTFSMHRLKTAEDLKALLAKATNRRMLTRLGASEAFLYLNTTS